MITPDGVRWHADGFSAGTLPRSFTQRMNRKFALLTALVAGLLPAAALAQISPAVPQPATPAPQAAPAASAAQPAPAAPAALPPPEAFPAKIALIAFEQAVISTNEGQQIVAEIQKKYEPRKAEIDQLGQEIDTLRKQVDATPSTLTAAEREAKLKTIDAKQKLYQSHVDDASSAYQADLQDAYGKIAGKVNTVMQTYAKLNGFTIVLDVSNQQSQVMWATQSPNSDITEAVIAAYNASTPGITAPPPAAPAPASATRPKPSTGTTPHTTTTPAKPPAKQ
jgi:outer membrane protein